jgi:hypothetical protein
VIIERACAILDPAAVAVKLRNAPDWVRRGVAQPLSPTYASVLCGVAAPGVSVPVRCAQDRRELPETFDVAAWHDALAAITKEKPVRLESRHHGGQLATTADGTLRLSIDHELGLLVEADLADEPLARMLVAAAGRSGIGLSVGFTTSKVEHRTVGREVVRVIRSARLDHVALVPQGQRPAYRSAIAYFAPHGDRQAIEAARREARSSAWRTTEAKRLSGRLRELAAG